MEAIRNGDVVLIDRAPQSLLTLSIKLGAKLRYGPFSPHTRYSHAAIIYDAADATGVRIVEATAGGGVQVARLSKYEGSRVDIVHTYVDGHDWEQVKCFLDDLIEKRTGYDYVANVALTLYALTGTNLCIQWAGTATCSGLVCDALTRAGRIWNRPPYLCTPADVSAHLQTGTGISVRERRRRRRWRSLRLAGVPNDGVIASRSLDRRPDGLDARSRASQAANQSTKGVPWRSRPEMRSR